MKVIYQKDSRSGITYVYNQQLYYNPQTNTTKVRKIVIGKLDVETGTIIPTNGNGKKRSIDPSSLVVNGEYKLPDNFEEMLALIKAVSMEQAKQKSEIEELRKDILILKNKLIINKTKS